MRNTSTSRTIKKPICAICGKAEAPHDMHPWAAIRPALSVLIQTDKPDWGPGQYICNTDLAKYRRRYVENLLEAERGEISSLETQVLDSLQQGNIISQNPENLISEKTSFGERMADGVASFGGSWTFIMSFGVVLIIWMLLNVTGWLFKPFDTYPFILLNLVLSCVAALQAPVIMMSQKRQETKDRLRAENDYKINLKAELEIRQLHDKIDHQLARQWERLAEIQQIQIEMLEEQAARK